MPSFEVIGDIAVVKSFSKSRRNNLRLAKDIMSSNNHIRTVLSQPRGIRGEYRTRELKWLIGERKTDTIHHEYGCAFYVDLQHVYYSPRLSFERIRISREVKAGETVLNMFGGIGSFSILIALHAPVSKVYSIDINPKAIRFTLKNIILNKIRRKIVAIFGDSKDLTRSLFHNKVDRVLMPLPLKSYECLPEAINALNDGRGIIHFYDFIYSSKIEDPIKKTISRVSSKMRELNVNFEIRFGRTVRSIGPNWHQTAIDIETK